MLSTLVPKEKVLAIDLALSFLFEVKRHLLNIDLYASETCLYFGEKILAFGLALSFHFEARTWHLLNIDLFMPLLIICSNLNLKFY